MLQILADEGATLQNVYAPLPPGVHIVFCIIATAVYAALFARRKTYNYLCLLAAVDLTLMTQFFTDGSVITALFIIEIGLLTAAAIYSFRASRAKKALKAADEDVADTDQQEEQEDQPEQGSEQESAEQEEADDE